MTATNDLHPLEAFRPGFVDLVQTTPRLTIGIEGFGSREQDAFRKAVDTLRPIAWAVHLALRKDKKTADHQLAPLEAQWWTEPGSELPCWRLFIGESESVPSDLVDRVVRDVPAARRLPEGRLIDVRNLGEGLAVQTLHVGGLEDVSAALAALRDFADRHDLVVTGPRHDIYLSHVRRCEPTHMRTVVRLPVRSA